MKPLPFEIFPAPGEVSMALMTENCKCPRDTSSRVGEHWQGWWAWSVCDAQIHFKFMCMYDLRQEIRFIFYMASECSHSICLMS